MERVAIGHISVDSYASDALVASLLEKAFTSERTHLVATINAQFYVLSSRETPFRECLRRAEFLCADGISIALAARWLSNQSIQRTPGVDLIGRLCKAGAAQGLRVFFLGGKPGSADATAHILKAENPGLHVAGVCCPAFGFERDPEQLQSVLSEIKAAQPHIVFVGLGAPKQEHFIDEYLRFLRVPVAVGVGGSFEMLSGQLRRAPLWLQSIGMEWFFRFAQEPRRLWRRYCIGNAEFLWIVWGHYWRSRRLETQAQMLEP
ncbi:WecB/TagA/CpsF family glycosyltransferase [Acidipila sp. EB88]|uniref:WecB/TagA/CpsF family glycosyltransferase n=1 Tax=Acidipila sp. EB88 TaxID=2305226 RepID=UPI000F5DE87B|nr:WecB/TagA/CpsF family glycosyltransferase [Acidipila sp. EB88]RRA48247.1 glycosyltransferase [Acidipila sp. EB88]